MKRMPGMTRMGAFIRWMNCHVLVIFCLDHGYPQIGQSTQKGLLFRRNKSPILVIPNILSALRRRTQHPDTGNGGAEDYSQTPRTLDTLFTIMGVRGTTNLADAQIKKVLFQKSPILAIPDILSALRRRTHPGTGSGEQKTPLGTAYWEPNILFSILLAG
jgi:hypothetical protein